jgi:uncharacterized protein
MLPDPMDSSQVNSETRIEPETPVQTPAAREPFWSYFDLLLVGGLLIPAVALIVLGAGLVVAFHPALKEDPTPLILPTQIALYILIYVDFWVVLKLRYGKPVMTSLGWQRPRINLLVVGTGGAALAFALSVFASLLHTPKVASPIDKLTSSPASLVLFGIIAVTIAPLFEELFFRGFIQPLLSRTFGVIAGILLTAALFGLLHAPEYSWAWQYALIVSLAGAVFGWLRARTNSIVPSTIMHGCYNAVFVVALAITKHA